MLRPCRHYYCVAALDLVLNPIDDNFALAFFEPEELVPISMNFHAYLF